MSMMCQIPSLRNCCPMLKKLLTLFALTIGVAAHADVITVRADTWCPFNCAPNSSKPGYMIEILQQTLGKKGHTIDYQEMNWARAITATRAGKFNAIVGATKTEVPDFVFPALSLGNAASCFYVLPKNNWQYAGIESLDTAVVGVVRDYTYDDDGDFDKYVKSHDNNPKRIEVISGDAPLERNLSKLTDGRISTLIEVDAAFQYHLRTLKKPLLVKKAGCLKSGSIHVAFSPTQAQSKVYAQMVSDGLIELRKSGALKKILSKYGIEDNF